MSPNPHAHFFSAHSQLAPKP